MSDILEIIKSKQLTYQQKLIQLAAAAENTLEVLNLSDDLKDFIKQGIICDLFEGQAPYRPRYILPDYDKFMKNGSKFLNLPAPSNLYEAVNSLLILYKHTPSITSFPVYLGSLDRLLDPFIDDEAQALAIIKLFLTHIDRTLTDSFVHANIGPKDSKAARLLLKAEAELVNSVPNLSLIYDHTTSDDFALAAIETGLKAAKPYFINHEMYKANFGENYGIASCYNAMPIGGGSFTLSRMNMKHLAQAAKDKTDFFENILPKGVKLMCELMDERIRFIVEESGFFESNFLIKEKLITRDNFVAMFGIHALAESVNHLQGATKLKHKFGHDSEADKLGEDILKALEIEINKHTNKYCTGSDGKFLLHAQCGIGTDINSSPGCRIPAGEEPETLEQIVQASKYHKFFPTGISDIFTFDETAQQNPQYLLDIIKGSMNAGLRCFSFYTKNADLVRITGYLVKKSEMEKFRNNEQNLKDTVALGAPSSDSFNIENRKVVKL